MKQYILLLTLIVFSLCSCSRKEFVKTDSVDSIVFYAMPKGIDFDHNYCSFYDMRRTYRDTLITDKAFIQTFCKKINKLQKDRSRRTLDMRAAAVVAMGNGDSLYVAFGESFGTVIMDDIYEDIMSSKDEYKKSLARPNIRLNGFPMKDDPSLFRMINEYVYAPHSNDYWRRYDDGIAWWLR